MQVKITCMEMAKQYPYTAGNVQPMLFYQPLYIHMLVNHTV
jgi:hypothetical protein